jgi:uncharacterized protein (DUF1684 family)
MAEAHMETTALVRHRHDKDRFLAKSHQSPLPPDDRPGFEGLDYYDPNPELVFTLPVEPADGAEVRVQTSDGSVRRYRRLGRVTFAVDGEAATLALYSTGHPGLFVPFRDATSGTDTYGAGRYLDVEPNGDGTVTIDFNYAYNPFCAYDDAYSCPLPPGENWLTVPIRAGEKTYG